ncbi:MAG: tRNA (adenosine(37)-N6)-threonylcarbamoyltransferase complex dimerization subunit type 1 TsaB [Casimicrobiaceae bacterium]
MRLLAIEGSTEWLSVCTYDDRVHALLRERAGMTASARILDFIRQALEQSGWKLHDLDGIAFGSGPGAFTGLRVVCGVVQGLASGAGLPVVGVSGLAAMAQAAWRQHRMPRVLACLDARMREVYVGAYLRGAGGWRILTEPAVMSPGEVMLPFSGSSDTDSPHPGSVVEGPGLASAQFDDPHGSRWFGAGSGFAVDPKLATRLALDRVDASIVPDAVHVAALAAPAFAAGDGRPAADAQPLYVRHRVALTEAERATGARL